MGADLKYGKEEERGSVRMSWEIEVGLQPYLAGLGMTAES
jgi:hypothetical protein